jgi:hypothetical protein
MSPLLRLDACRYSKAHAALLSLLTKHPDVPNRKELQALADSAAARAQEQDQGQYDMGAMHKAADTTSHHFCRIKTAVRVHRFECADYVGPLRMEQIPGKGRGLVATRSVAAGELVLAVKADAIQAFEEVRHQINTAQHRKWTCPCNHDHVCGNSANLPVCRSA